jgi:6-phosphogluconolactonase
MNARVLPLCMLPFDHRASFKTGLFAWKGEISREQTARIEDAKQVVYEALLQAIAHGVPRERVSVLVDEQYGSAILADARARGIATALTVEKSGQAEFDFEYGQDFARHIEAMNPTYSKVLVRYNAGGDRALNERQAKRLRRLSEYLHGAGRKFLFELLVPPEPTQLAQVDGDPGAYDLELRPALVVQGMHELQDAGVEPDIWKLEGLDRLADCAEVGRAAQRGDRVGVSCIVLGRHADDAHVIRWLDVAAQVPEFEGFAVGRSTFWDALVDLIAGRASRAEAVDRIERQFRRWVDAWDAARQRARAGAEAGPGVAVEIFSDEVALGWAEAEDVIEVARAAIEKTGRFSIALAGGSTPRPLYELLAKQGYAERIDWKRVHVFFGDERCVSPDDVASNFRMASEALLSRVPLPPENIHRIRGEDPPAAAAQAYERELRAFFGVSDVGAPERTFDLALLGLGGDGHTASLFPTRPELRDERRWVVATRAPEGTVAPDRVTLTPAALNAAAHVVFLVSGASKAERVNELLREAGGNPALPAEWIHPRHGTLAWRMDAATASRLQARTATPVKLVVADVDGTLVTKSKELTPRAKAAVAALRDAGIAFAVTSGRPPRGMATLVEPLGLTTAVAAFNGGMLVQPDLTTIIEQRSLPKAAAVEVVERLLAAGLDAWVYRGADWYLRDPSAPHVARERSTVRFEPTVIPDLREALDAAVKIVGVSDDHALVARVEAELRDTMGARAWAARSQPHYLDVTHPDANKGSVVRGLSRRLGIPLEQIATIGDMPTDVLMFAVSGVSIAMGNASPDVQRTARHVTATNEDDGFAKAIERFVLGRSLAPPVKLGLPPRTRALLFDLDGVLTQTSAVHARAWKKAFDDFLAARARATNGPFVPFDEVKDYENYVDGKPRVEGVRSFLESRGIQLAEGKPDDPPTADTLHGLGNRKNELLLDILHRHPAETFEGSVRYLLAARSAGLLTAVVSSSKNCKEVIDSAGIADQFDVRVDGVVAQEKHLAGKPAPDTFLAAARELGVAPEEAVVFEDALAGVEAGRAGHFGYVVGVDRLGQASELRRHGADLVVSDLAALL